jgi:hypothetical protein
VCRKTSVPNADTFQYVVQEVEKPNVFIVRSQQICRKKGLLSHDKCKMLLKEFCHVTADGSWKVKVSAFVPRSNSYSTEPYK